MTTDDVSVHDKMEFDGRLVLETVYRVEIFIIILILGLR